MRFIYNKIKYDGSIPNTWKSVMNAAINDELKAITKDLWVTKSISNSRIRSVNS